MRYLALCYHDVTPAGVEPGGFPGTAAATYKLALSRFEEHLKAVACSRKHTPFEIVWTFDDGGSGSLYTADALEQAGYRGSFFITSGLIGKPGFITAAQIADLHTRGHIIGSHGATHRGRMNRMAENLVHREWSESVQTLSEIIQAPVETASVPSGFYGPLVAKTAREAGIRCIFTQQPTTRPAQAFGCEILGRFTMRSWTPLARVASLARGGMWPRFEDAALWRARQIAKTLGGSVYSDLRKTFFERRSQAGLS